MLHTVSFYRYSVFYPYIPAFLFIYLLNFYLYISIHIYLIFPSYLSTLFLSIYFYLYILSIYSIYISFFQVSISVLTILYLSIQLFDPTKTLTTRQSAFYLNIQLKKIKLRNKKQILQQPCIRNLEQATHFHQRCSTPIAFKIS